MWEAVANSLAALHEAGMDHRTRTEIVAKHRARQAQLAQQFRAFQSDDEWDAALKAKTDATRIEVLYGWQTIRPAPIAPLVDTPAPAAPEARPEQRARVTADEARKYRAILFPRWTFHSPFRGLELWLYRLLRPFA